MRLLWSIEHRVQATSRLVDKGLLLRDRDSSDSRRVHLVRGRKPRQVLQVIASALDDDVHYLII
jgi:hypothetical protein